MLLLALDTAGPNCAVALVRGDGSSLELLSRREDRIGRGHAERLMPMIEEALSEAGARLTGLDRVAVTTGPGSFAGVRVGIAAARALALALDIPAIGIGTLAALAFPVAQERREGTVVAALDARRGEIHAFAQDAVSGAIVLAPVAGPPGEIVRRLVSAARPLVLVGAGAFLLAASLGEAEIAGTDEAPNIADVAALGLREDAKGPPVPLYVRGADAKPQSDKAVARR